MSAPRIDAETANRASAEDFEESPAVRIGRLERALRDQRRFSAKATRQLHSQMVKDLRRAEKRAVTAEQQVRRLRARAERAEAEVDAVRRSATWRAGTAVLAVPRRIRSLRS